MSDDPTVLNDALDALGFSRQGTLAEANNIPDNRWDYRPNPRSRTVAELVRHIIEVTAMLVGEAADREGDFRRRSYPEHIDAHVGELPENMTPGELREALSRMHDTSVDRVRGAGEAHMATAIRRFDGGHWTRVGYVFYAASHEEYHRGQLALYARMLGLIPALTRQIYGDGAE